MSIASRIIGRAGRWLASAACLAAASFAGAAEKVAVVVGGGDDAPKVIIREGAEKPWHLTKDKDALEAGWQLVGGLGTTIVSANGAVQARLVADLAEHSPFPILETSILLQEPKGADMAFVLERGRIDLLNMKKAGAATIRITVRDMTGTVTLKEPGSRLVIEMYSRWAKGVPFKLKPTEKDVPAMVLMFIAVKGEIELKGSEQTFELKAPPGPAMLILDSLSDGEPQVQSLEKVPEWVDEKEPEKFKRIKEGLKAMRDHADKVPLGQGLLLMTLSEDEEIRKTGMILLGALDDLPRLAVAMATARHSDVPEEGIVVLRRWIGRGPGQDLKLYNALVEKGSFKPAEAELTLQLLHSFGDDELKKPHLYQALIHFLDSDRALIRALAHWHLVRLVPEGRKIAFKTIDAKERHQNMIKAWKDMIPEGTLPGSKPQ